MRRFTFRLARLEQLRDLKRREARRVLAGASAEVRARRAASEQAARAFEASLAADLPAEAASDPRQWRALAAWRGGQRSLVVEAERREEQAAEAARQALERHTEAARGHRVIERLRERRYRRWLEEAELEERKLLDELHLLRLVRERSGDASTGIEEG